jgi:hypothetical protein
MTTRRIRATPLQIHRLLDEVQALSGDPIGGHLTGAQHTAYSVDPSALNERERSTVESHLSSCDECLDLMERLFDRKSSYGAVVRLADWLLGLPTYPAALPDAAAAPLESESPAQSDHVFIGDDAEQNLRVVVSSFDDRLLGARIRVEPFGRSFVLEQVAPDQIGGEVVVPRAQRTGLPLDAIVRLAIEPAEEP